MTEIMQAWNNNTSKKYMAPPSPQLSQDELVHDLRVLDNKSLVNNDNALLPKVLSPPMSYQYEYNDNVSETEDVVYKMYTELVSLVHWEIPGRSGIVFCGILSSLILTRYYSLLYVFAAILTIMTGFNLIFVNAYTLIQAIWTGLPIQQSQHPYHVQIKGHQYHLVSRDLLEYYVDKTLNILEVFIQKVLAILLVDDSKLTGIAFAISLFTYYIAGFIPTKLFVSLFVVGLFTIPYYYGQHQEEVDAYLLSLQQDSKTAFHRYSAITREHSKTVYEKGLVISTAVSEAVQHQIVQLKSLSKEYCNMGRKFSL